MTTTRHALAAAFLSLALPTSILSNIVPPRSPEPPRPPAPVQTVKLQKTNSLVPAPSNPVPQIPNSNSETPTSTGENDTSNTPTPLAPNTGATQSNPSPAPEKTLTPPESTPPENARTESDDGVTVSSPLPNTWLSLRGELRSNTGLAPTQRSFAAPAPQLQSSEPSVGPNLIPNPSLETTSGSVPVSWAKGGYGTNTRAFTYPVDGSGGSGSKAIRVTVSNYSGGDAKWFFDDVAIEGGAQYKFSNKSYGNVASIITVRYKLADGSFMYKDVATVNPSGSFQTNTVTFTAPQNAVALTVFHLLNRDGSLTTDEYSLQKITVAPQDTGNLVKNGGFETAAQNGLPVNWIKGGYGTNNRAFTYPAPGESGNGANVRITSYTSGDAKWSFDHVPVTPGSAYIYSNTYRSDAQTILTAQYKKSDGSLVYSDLRILPSASTWTPIAVEFTVPTGVASVSVFHLLKSVGSLSIDNVALKASGGSSGGGVFTTGAVTFRFDDGVDSHYSVAAPKLESAGFKGVFYIVSQQVFDRGFSGYMSIANIKNLAARGHEIGAHTRTHAHLSQLSESQQRQEIEGSRQDIQAWNVGSVLSFAYPYGDYSAATLNIVESAGFTTGASTIDDFVKPSSDPYQLEHQEMNPTISFSRAKAWIDAAAANKTWLILTFHRIDGSGVDYSITPALFNQIVDYVKQKGIPVVTITQGRQSMP